MNRERKRGRVRICELSFSCLRLLEIETSKTRNSFSEEVENLYDIILANIKRIYSEGDEGKDKWNLGYLLSFISQVSEKGKEVGKSHRISIVRYGEKEIYDKVKDPKIKFIKNSEKMAGFGVARTAKEVFPELVRRLEGINGPNITVVS
jgi:hypothetical protein